MSELDGARDDDELAAAEVDAILATADEQLLRYVRAAVDSSKALLEIMVGADTDPADSAAAIIETRIRLRELVRAISKARALASKLRDVFLDEHCKTEEPDLNRVWLARWLDRALFFIRGHADDLQAVRDLLPLDPGLGGNLPGAADSVESLYRDLARDQRRVLARALASSGSLDRLIASHPNDIRVSDLRDAGDIFRFFVLDIALPDMSRYAPGFFQNLERALAQIHGAALARAREFGAVPVDASSADLSGLELWDVGALAGVVWTRDTAWPLSAAEQIEASSSELHPGVYLVRDSGKPDPSLMITV